MDKKPLIEVSILAVVLLVLGSLSNVVGYQSVKSSVNDSPLFQTRTQRATNQQQNSITSQYLGMGKGTLLLFPIKHDNNVVLKRAVDIISKMDDSTFERFTELCIQRVKQKTIFNEINSNEIKQTLVLLRTNPEIIINSYTNSNNQFFSASGLLSLCHPAPLCVITFIIATFAPILAFTLILLVEIAFYLFENPWLENIV